MSLHRERLLDAASINSAFPPSALRRPSDGRTDDEDEREDDEQGEEEEEEVDDVEEAETGRSTTTDAATSSARRTKAVEGEKRLRYTCCGATRGCLMSHPQWVASVLLIVALVLTVVLLIVFLAIVPAIISSAVAASDVTIGSVSISHPDSAARMMHLNTSMSITHAGAFSAQLHEMTVSISHLEDDGVTYSPSIGSMTVQPIHLDGDTEVNISSDLRIDDMDAFNGFVEKLLQQPTVTWHLSASASVTPYLGSFALPTYSSVAFEKDVTVQGCAGLSQSWVNSFSLASSNATSANVQLNITILNPSSFTISPLGTLHFLILFHDQYIGDMYSINAALVPGNNTLPMIGSLARTTARAEHDLIQLFLTGQTASVIASAAADASSIPLFNAGMRGLNISTAVPGNELNLVRSLTFESLQLTPSASGMTALLNAGLQLTINSPLGEHSPLALQTVAIDSVLMYQGQPMGAVLSGAVPVSAVPGMADTFRTNLTGELRLLGNGSVYKAFVSALVPAVSLSLMVVGSTDITASYVLGNLSATSLPITASSSMPGLQSLAPVQERGLNITGAIDCVFHPCGLTVSMAASLFNPAPVAVTLQRSALLLSYKGDQLGRVQAEVLDIQPGPNFLTLTGELWPGSDEATVSEFIDDFIHARPVSVQLAGDSSLEANGSASALTTSALHLTAAVQGQDCAESLIQSLSMSNFSIDFRNSSVLVSSSIRAAFALPDNLAIPQLSISSVDLHATVWLNSTTSMGNLSVLHLPVTFEHHPHPPDYLNISLVQAELQVASHNIDAFTAFADDLLLSHSASFSLLAAAAALADTPLGRLSLSAIPTNSSLVFSGLNRFVSPTTGESLFTINSYDITATHSTWMEVTTNISIENPSNVSLHSLGTLELDFVFNNSKLGQVTLPSFSLPRGVMTHTAKANISQPTAHTADSLDHFISAMINGTVSPISLRGGLDMGNGTVVAGTSIPLLQPTIRSFVSPSQFPGLTSPFIEWFNADLTLKQLLLHVMPTTIMVHNPFSAYLTIDEADMQVFSTEEPGLQIGYWKQNLREEGQSIVFDPNSSRVSALINITTSLNSLSGDWEIIKDLFLKHPGHLFVNSVGRLTTSIYMPGSEAHPFTQVVDIDARDITCYVKL